MEQFDKWRDKYTGLRPFLPNRLQIPKPPKGIFLVWHYLCYYFLLPIICLLRMVLAFLIFLELCIITFVVEYPLSMLSFPPFTWFKRFYKKITMLIYCRFLLFALGYWSIDAQISETLRTRQRTIFEESSTKQIKKQTNIDKLTKTKSQTKILKKSSDLKFNSGDLIIANSNSIASILYLGFRFAPQFTVMPNNWKEGEGYPGEDGCVKKRNLITCIFDLLFNIKHEKNGKNLKKYIPLAQLIKQSKKRSGGPVVVFPDGLSTNGSGMLEFLPIFEDSNLEKDQPNKIVLLGFKNLKKTRKNQIFNPSFSIGNPFKHLVSTCYPLANKLMVKIINPIEVPLLPKPTIESQQNEKDNESDESNENSDQESSDEFEHSNENSQKMIIWTEMLQESLCKGLKVQKTKFVTIDKFEFMEAWKEREMQFKNKEKEKKEK
ncbi:lysophosphatidic acid [Anaeramoeba flamelloides]|uniref:Lysophosphatidic acid n=1 Tax=Anaeramoeba flamelloides TaxID=1746091 RepID=A0AAV7YLY1_9EUKA|nr:lysophosphatidic acid [Anaeramoeba flamelloides]